MFAMHYDIHLPRDYDMGAIRDRVATRGHALDDLDGLHLKAYLVRDVAAGAALNSYSPFYLWTEDTAAARFLWGGGGFAGIVRDFSRPPVRTWLVGRHLAGATTSPPTRAQVAHVVLPGDTVLEDLATAAADVVGVTASTPLTYSATYLLDPRTWTLTFLTLSAGDADDGAAPRSGSTPPEPAPEIAGILRAMGGVARTESFEVLHLSAPPAGRLP